MLCHMFCRCFITPSLNRPRQDLCPTVPVGAGLDEWADDLRVQRVNLLNLRATNTTVSVEMDGTKAVLLNFWGVTVPSSPHAVFTSLEKKRNLPE